MCPDLHGVNRVCRIGLIAAFCACLIVVLWGGPAGAHVSNSGLVLLLPTDTYIGAGVAVVALTVVVLALLPGRTADVLFRPLRMRGPRRPNVSPVTGLASLCLLMLLIWAGLTGARDPLVNPLPLAVWTLVWVGLVLAQGVVGDVWRYLDPWSGLCRVIGTARAVRLPEWLGHWPTCAGLLAFAGFALADPAPDDPARLAGLVAIYTGVTLAGALLCGARAWLGRCEFFSVLLRLFAGLAPVRRRGRGIAVGFPGWRLLALRRPPLSLAIFALITLGVGSFDGLNETFWWLALIDVNPLAFPGRSAIIGETLAGLLATNLLLICAFTTCICAGGWLGGAPLPFAPLALTLVPIAFAYHFAHYLPVLLVNGQYAIAALSDPLGRGDDWLGLGRYYVTTGFLTDPAQVEVIFLSQAGAVVVGHVLSVAMAHAVAARHCPTHARALLSQIPLAGFMVAYTFLGLWLLAAPKGA